MRSVPKPSSAISTGRNKSLVKVIKYDFQQNGQKLHA